MKYLNIVAVALLFCLGIAQAQEPPPPAENWEQLRAQAKALRDQADQMRAESKAAVEVANKICWEKFLVSSCMEDAKLADKKTVTESRQIDLEALAIERRIAAHDLEVKRAKKEEKQKKREEKAAKKAEALRLEDEARERKEEERRAKEERRQQKKD